MPRASVSTGMELEYDSFGSPDDPTLLLIMGFTAQMTAWPDGFCKLLADRGLNVVRFDNRDCGLSTKLDGVAVDIGAIMTAVIAGGEVGEVGEVPYTLSDMAADAVGLLDQIGVERAHVMGASMGGMIAQTVAIEHPQRCLSLISVMSTSGGRNVGRAAPEAIATLLAPPPTDRASYIESSSNWLVWASKKHRDEALNRERAAAAFDRSSYPEGASRQMAAIAGSADRSARLVSIAVPTLVIHGRDDTLIDQSGAIDTAEKIPGAHLLLLADMGHDLPEPLWPTIIDAVDSHVRSAG